jgi:hypothetical protein
MTRLTPATVDETPSLPPDLGPDYGSRALALWPRLGRRGLTRVRHDPRRVAALVSRRTTLPPRAILELLGASADHTDAPRPHH